MAYAWKWSEITSKSSTSDAIIAASQYIDSTVIDKACLHHHWLTCCRWFDGEFYTCKTLSHDVPETWSLPCSVDGNRIHWHEMPVCLSHESLKRDNRLLLFWWIDHSSENAQAQSWLRPKSPSSPRQDWVAILANIQHDMTIWDNFRLTCLQFIDLLAFSAPLSNLWQRSSVSNPSQPFQHSVMLGYILLFATICLAQQSKSSKRGIAYLGTPHSADYNIFLGKQSPINWYYNW